MRGGRISSAELRHAQQLGEDFAGLAADTKRYDLLLLVKRAGKVAGFSSRMIQLLDYYLAFTRDCDWEEGARPIVYQSLAKTALDLGVSERQIQRLEQALFEAGALSWHDSGNHRRYGQRCPKTGRIQYAYGVDLTPLAYLKPELETRLAEKGLYDQAWLETKRQISWYRRQLNALLAEVGEAGAHTERLERLSMPIRTYMTLEALRSLLGEHKSLHQQILTRIEEEGTAPELEMPDQPSSSDDRNVVHSYYSTQESFNELNCRPQASCWQESVIDPPRSRPGAGASPESQPAEGRDVISGTGLQHVTLKQVLNAASERFKAHIPLEPRPMNWPDVVEAAYRLKPELRINQQSWGEGCLTLGRAGAAVCLLLTDQAMQREIDPVRQPGAYFRAMIQRARTGDLHLHNSIFGLLKREPLPDVV